MKIIETADRTPTLLRQLLEVWERSVRATHLFLSDGEIRQIKQYVPQALGGIEHLIIAEDGAGGPRRLWGSKTGPWRCCSSPRRRGAEGWENDFSNTGLKTMGLSGLP